MSARIERRTARIEELDYGWMVTPPGDVHDTATEALRSVTEKAKQEADAGVSSITTISWSWHSEAGRAIVSVLTGGAS